MSWQTKTLIKQRNWVVTFIWLRSLYFVQLKKNFCKGRKYRNIHLKKNMMPYPTCIAPNGHSIQPDRTIVCEHSTFQLYRPPKRDKQLQKIPNYIMHLNSIILEPRFHSSKSVPFILLYPNIYVSKISTFRAALWWEVGNTFWPVITKTVVFLYIK